MKELQELQLKNARREAVLIDKQMQLVDLETEYLLDWIKLRGQKKINDHCPSVTYNTGTDLRGRNE